MRVHSILFLAGACQLLGCSANTAVDERADGGAPAVCPDEWTVQLTNPVFVRRSSALAVTAEATTYFLTSDHVGDAGVDARTTARSLDRCGRSRVGFGPDVGAYQMDDKNALRAVLVAGADRTDWNGIRLPQLRSDQLAAIEFDDDLRVFRIDVLAASLYEPLSIRYAWGGRADVTVGPAGTSFAPTIAFRNATTGSAWSVTAPPGVRSGVPRAVALAGNRAVVAAWEASADSTPSALLVDAFSNDARHVWRARVPTTDWFPRAAVLDDGSTLLLRYAPPPGDLLSSPDGLVLTRISQTGEVSPWTTIGADNVVSGEWSMSVGRDGRAVIAIAAVNSRVKLCGTRYPGSVSDTETRAYVVGVDEFGKCAFVRPFDGFRGNTRVSDTYLTDDQHVIVVWEDQYTDSGPLVPDPRAHQIIERVRWETLVARWGTSSNAPDAGL